MSDSFATSWTVGHQALVSMNSPGKNTGVGCHFLLQGIFLNWCVLHWQVDFLLLSHLGNIHIRERQREAQSKRRGFKELTSKELARLKPTGQAGKLEFR